MPMSEGRRNSIGTLTGWQLLANQVRDKDEDEDSDSAADSSDDSGDDADRTGYGAAGDDSSSRKGGGLHLRSLSNTSNLSEESTIGGSTSACVTPRPHQWLYKEYKILDEIGSGGFGRVCRARRLADGRMVVVKEINTTSLSAKQKSATMDEVLVLAKLNHPNIVKYHDCYMDAVYINIVMEYCNGGDLAGLIKARDGKLMPEEEIMSLFVQICLAMQYVHMAGVLHRDIKASNVLITRADNFGGMPLLKLGDFGVAKMNSAESSMASTIVGTPQYLSPEMCDNKPYGKKSDVWALGCILYELCCLSKAFDLGSGGISGIILKIMKGTYEPIPAAYSDDMKALVGAMLQVKPRRRPNVSDVLNMPYVRRHLGLYLDWARNVPQAHPQVLLASLGDLWPRKGQQADGQQQQQQGQQQPQQQQHPPMLDTIGSGGSCSSLETNHHGPLSPQQSQQQQQQLEQQGSSPQGLYAASSRAATPSSRRISGTGSNSSFIGPASGSAVSSTDMLMRQASNLSNSARSGSATPRSAAAAAAVAQLAPAGSSAEQEHHEHQQQQQQQQQRHHVGHTAWTAVAAAGAVGAAAAAAAVRGAGALLSSPSSSLSPNGSSTPPLPGGGSGSPIPALSGPSGGGPPPGSLSGWLGGDTSLQKRQQIQQQVLASHQELNEQRPDSASSSSQQQQDKQQHDQTPAVQPDHRGSFELSPHHQQQSQQQQQQPQQQQQQQRSRQGFPAPGDSSLSPFVAAGSRSSGNIMQQQQQGNAAAAAAAGGVVPQPPSALEPNLSTTSSQSADHSQLATGWAYPSVAADTHRATPTRTSVAQEQLDGLKAIWGLKAKLQVKPDVSGGSPGAAAGRLLRDQLQQGGGGSGSHQQQQGGGGSHWSAIAEADAALNI